MEDKKMMELAAAYIDGHRQEMLELWDALVSIESGTANKEGVDQVCQLLQKELKKNPFRIDENGCVHGPGCLDMKAGLVMAVFVLRALRAAGYQKRPVKVVFAGDEENGHRKSTAEAEMRSFARGSAAARWIGYGPVKTKAVGGWSDSCLASSEGVPIVCAMGVKGANNHSMEEYAVADTLFDRTKLALASIITMA